MPIFEYKAINAQGKHIKGLVEAENGKAARLKLKKSRLMVSSMTERTTKKGARNSGASLFGARVGVKDISLLTRQLASLIKANIPLVEALNALVEQTDKESLKVVVSRVRDDVNEGASLGKALQAHPKVFDTIFVNMVEAGESSGTLGLVLLRLADLKEAQLRLQNKLISSMMYPVLMMIVAAVLMIAIFTFVIPKLSQVFTSLNKPLPMTTKVLIEISNVLTNWWYLFLLGGIIALFLFKKFISSPTGKPKWDRFKLRTPVFGPLIRMIAVTRFSTTMATLLSSGVPILTAMSISKNLVGNTLIAKAIEDARENITEGQSIAEPLKKSGEFPPLVIHMIAIGERTGELPEMLKNISSTYEEQVNARIEGMTALVEPAMIIGMGGVVGFIVVSIFIPLMEVSNIR